MRSERSRFVTGPTTAGLGTAQALGLSPCKGDLPTTVRGREKITSSPWQHGVRSQKKGRSRWGRSGRGRQQGFFVMTSGPERWDHLDGSTRKGERSRVMTKGIRILARAAVYKYEYGGACGSPLQEERRHKPSTAHNVTVFARMNILYVIYIRIGLELSVIQREKSVCTRAYTLDPTRVLCHDCQ